MGEDAESKKIARLDFDIKDAINSLDSVNEKLKKIAEQSGLYSKQIGKNIGSSFDFSKVLNVDSFSQQLSKVTNISEAQAKKLVANIMKNEQDVTAKTKIEQEKRQTAIVQSNVKQLESEARTADRIKVISAEVEGYKEKKAYSAALKQEEYNNRVADSTKTLYDKISNYAGTYLIYQGFNVLKRSVGEVIDEMVELESSMVQIDRVLNESSLDIDNYRDKLMQTAYDYGNSMQNVADITLRLAQAGFDSNESLKLTEKTLLALNTAELNATQATDDMVAVMAQWGYMTGDANEKARQYGDIIDKINKVADNFPTTSADIMDALKKVSSAFNLAGANIDETIATIVAAEKASQRGGKVIGTALANIVQQIKAEKKLDLAEQLGLNFFKDAKKTEFKPIMEIFQEMSDRMAALKSQGKESSTEMQQLLELFTVFRRNIGASLLGEMEGGEESTYMKVYKASLNSVGYSLQENAKYMATAKAAQEQLNVELLKLKTQVWDGGLEDVYRGMLQTGNDLIQGLSKLIDKFGLIPTAIGAITATYTVLKNKVKIQDIGALTKRVAAINKAIQETGTNLKAEDKLLEGTSQSFKKYVTSVDNGKVSLGGYAKELVTSSIRTAALTAATIALNAAISMGISLAVTALASAIDNWVHAEEKAIEKNKQLKQEAEDAANELNEQVKSIQDLTKEYKEFSETVKNSKDKNKLVDTENVKKAYELQEKINKAIEDSGRQVELVTKENKKNGKEVDKVNTKYKEQLALLRTIAFEKKQEEVRGLKTAMELAKQNAANTKTTRTEGALGWATDIKVRSQLEDAGFKAIGEDSGNIMDWLDTVGANTKILMLEKMQKKLNELSKEGKNYSEALEYVNKNLKIAEDTQKGVTDATEKYKNALSELYAMSGQVDVFDTMLKSIADSYQKIEGPNKLIKDIQSINEQFREGKIDTEEYFNNFRDQIDKINLSEKLKPEELQAYQAIFAATTETMAEGLEQLISGFESGTINFADYSSQIQEVAENTLDLYTKQNQLKQDIDGVWRNAAGAVDEYANSLQNALNGMNELTELMPVISENYDYIAQHANEAGEAAFKQSDRTSQAYKNLANEVANSLNVMRTQNNEAYVDITNAVLRSTKKITNEEKNANNWINKALLSDANALNAALNESANQLSTNTSKVTSSLGNVISALGKAISSFSYKITATPFKEGNFGITTNEFGLPTGVELPHFGFKLTGEGGSSIQDLSSALTQFGSDLNDYSTSKFKYTTLKSAVGDYTGSSPITTSTPSSPGSKSTKGSKGSKGGGSGSSSSDDKAKKEEEKKKKEYEKRLKKFTETLEKMEDKEEAWVKKQRELGQLSNSDMLYITQNRIKNYQKYLDKVKKAKWMNKEDRKKLEAKYTEEIKKLQLEYFNYLKGKLDDQTKAIEKSRDERIKILEDETERRKKLINEEADARIAALKKVSDERERDREKADYKKERQEILDEIAYWQQRTGREAVENLANAKKRLQELDKDWKEKVEDWKTEDTIKSIEEQRDAQIKSLEELEEKEKKQIQAQAQLQIDALNKEYAYKIKAFSESDKIIYDNSVIASKNLYKAYKTNFVDKIKQDLKSISNTTGEKVKTLSTTLQSKFGNIDVTREGIKWTDKNLKKYKEQLKEMGINTKDLKNSYSNILGASRAYSTGKGEVEIAYSPFLQTKKGLSLLFQDEIDEYIQEVVKQAQKAVKKGTYSNLKKAVLAIDKAGIKGYKNTEGYQIKGLIADVGNTAIKTGEQMHINAEKLLKAKLKLPMFHNGGIFTGVEEGLALLKKGEVTLKPEWSASLNRMMKYFDNVAQGKATPISNNNIAVEGNLVNIQANVRSQSDIDAIGQKVEKILKDKFNIKK